MAVHRYARFVGVVIYLVAAASVANAFSGAGDIHWRLGTPNNLWEPMLWNLTRRLRQR
jgi:hypothetical protein